MGLGIAARHMKASIQQKLEGLSARKQALAVQLSDPKVISDQALYGKLSKELHSLTPVVEAYSELQQLQQQLQDCTELMQDADSTMQELLQEELLDLRKKIAALETAIMQLLLPRDPDDDKNAYLEIRAGTGGDEASLFSGDLFRMYQLFAQSQGWKWQVIQSSLSEQGGYKEVVIHVLGKDVFGKLKFESGTHRVQRVPVTESQGRIHTSACTVAILPEAEQVDDLDLAMSDIRVDTFRSSGAGGQHVNTTDSAVRLTHIPTGVVVECQDERSQHKNKARALKLLQSKIVSMQRAQLEQDRAQTRRLQVGSGDRSERIRTYNFPQGRVTDHRINLTLYKLDVILAGELQWLVEPLLQEDQADKMASLQNEYEQDAGSQG